MGGSSPKDVEIIMECFSDPLDLQSRAFSLEETFSEMRLTKGEIEELASLSKNTVTAVNRSINPN